MKRLLHKLRLWFTPTVVSPIGDRLVSYRRIP